MRKLLFIITFLVFVSYTSFASETVCIFKHSNIDSLSAIKNYLSQNFTTVFVTDYNFSDCDLLIIDQEEKNSANPIFDRNKMINEIKRTKVPTVLVFNSVMLINPLFGVYDVTTGYWSPVTNDVLYIKVVDNSTFLDYPIGTEIEVWRQIPGDDYSWYFYKKDNTSGEIYAYEKICYFGSCGITYPGVVYYENNGLKSTAFPFLRFSSQFHPTPEAFSILGKAVRFMLYGSVKASNVEVEEASWKGNLIVEFNSSHPFDGGCEPNLTSIKVDGRPVNFSQEYFKVLRNYSSGYARYKFSADVDSRHLGNVSVEFEDSCGHLGRFEVIRTNRRRSRILMVVGDDREAVLYSSIYGYPLIVYDGSRFKELWIERARKRINPLTVLCVDTDYEGCDFIIDHQSLRYQFPRNGSVMVGYNKTFELYGFAYAALHGMDVVRPSGNEASDLMFDGPCFAEECWSGRVNRPGMKEDLLRAFPYTGKYAAINPYSSISALSPILAVNGYVPLVLDGKGNSYEESGMGINLSRKAITGSESERVLDEMTSMIYIHTRATRPRPDRITEYPVVVLVGLPFARLESPLPSWISNESIISDAAYRGGRGKYTSRIVSDLQLLPLFVDTGKGDVLIAASYRQPRYMDAQLTGMDAGFVMDLFLRIRGFNVTRRIEQRIDLGSLLLDNFDFMSEDAFLEAMIQEVLDNLGVASAFNKYMDMKYTLLETDWEETLFNYNPSLLERLNNSKLSRDLEESEILFYFGVSNSTHLILPEDKSPYERNLITNPYPPGNELGYENISTMINILDSSNSLSGMENATGFSQLPFVIGFSANNYDPFSAMNLFAYISTIRGNDSLSSVGWRMKDYSALLRDQSLLGKIFSLPRAFMEYQYLSMNILGLPEVKIDPTPDKDGINITYDGKWHVRLERRFNFTFKNSTIYYSKPDFYLMFPGYPIAPVYMYELPINGRVVDVNFIPDVGETNLIPLYVPSNMTYGNFSMGEWNNSWYYLSNESGIRVYVIPVKYHENRYLKGFAIDVEYMPEFDVWWRCVNGTLEFGTTQNSSVSVPEINFSGNGTEFSVRLDGKATIHAFNGTDVIRRSVECQKPLEFKKPRFTVIKSMKSPEGFMKLMANSFMSISYLISNSSRLVMQTPSLILEAETTPTSLEKVFITPDYKLTLMKGNGRWVAKIETPYGWLERRMERGEMTERAYGELSRLDDIMDKAMESLRMNNSYAKFLLEEVG